MENEFVTSKEIQVACDTGILWCIIYNKAPWLADFITMANSGVVFSFADHALGEIVNQLEQNRFSEADYAKAVKICEGFISEKVPILPGKKQLAEWCSDTPGTDFLDEDSRYRTACWALMKSATGIQDFENGITYQLLNGTKKHIGLQRGEAEKALEDERNTWRKHLASPRPGWQQLPLDTRLAQLAGELDKDIQCHPPLTVRLDAALRHEDEMICLRSNPKAPLNPDSERRRNDGIDYNMSFVFMKKILLCTADSTYRDKVRSLGSYQSDWIFTPSELADVWRAGNLTRPEWEVKS